MKYLNETEIQMLKETFISQYCAEKGWNKTKLNTEQLLEIMSKTEYKNPGLLKS